MLRRSVVAISAVSLIALLAWTHWPAPPTAPLQADAAAAKEAVVDESVADAPTIVMQTIEIGRRDTLVAALLRHELPARVAHEVASALTAAGTDLRRIRPGDRFTLQRHEDGRLAGLSYAPNPWQRFVAAERDGGWEVETTQIEPEIRVELRQGEIRRSLWDAVDTDGVSPQLVLDLAQIFESEFDFTADTRIGDRFRLLVEARYAEGVLVDHGRILAAQYVSDGRTLTGVGFASAGSFTYFDAEGRSLRKMFLRSPLRFTRITSGFTYRRPHPILGGVRPHLAIDYAAPTGTPVWAVADGTVRFAGWKGGNGIQVLLRHRAGYETYYNHLSRVAPGIRPGAQVRQKQVIGYVGSTGLSTGPHLDYRVSRNGRFVNPLSEKFLPGDPIAAADRDRFLEHADTLLQRLEREAPFAI